MKEKTGKLTFVSKIGGLFLDDKKTWINPTKEAKDRIIERHAELMSKVGSQVTLRMEDDGCYKSIEVHTDEPPEPKKKEEKKEEKSEEKTEDIPEEQIESTEPMQASDIELNGTFLWNPSESQYDKECFNKLSKIQCKTEKKGNLTYISWADAWTALKKEYPGATYIVHENKNGMPYFHDSTGAFVKVGVTVSGTTYTNFLPIMDYKNKSIKLESITTFDTNKAIQRALTKAIAMHGLGLHLYRGEDLVDTEE